MGVGEVVLRSPTSSRVRLASGPGAATSTSLGARLAGIGLKQLRAIAGDLIAALHQVGDHHCLFSFCFHFLLWGLAACALCLERALLRCQASGGPASLWPINRRRGITRLLKPTP